MGQALPSRPRSGPRSTAPAAPQARPRQGTRPLGATYTHRLHSLQKLTDKVTLAAYGAVTDLSLGEGRCLTAVGAFAPLSVQHLAYAANVDKGQASRAAQALVLRGLVRKQPDPDDARGVVLSFTPEGEALYHRLMKVIHRRNAEIVACLSPAEQAQFDRMLSKLVAHARQVADLK